MGVETKKKDLGLGCLVLWFLTYSLAHSNHVFKLSLCLCLTFFFFLRYASGFVFGEKKEVGLHEEEDREFNEFVLLCLHLRGRMFL